MVDQLVCLLAIMFAGRSQAIKPVTTSMVAAVGQADSIDEGNWRRPTDWATATMIDAVCEPSLAALASENNGSGRGDCPRRVPMHGFHDPSRRWSLNLCVIASLPKKGSRSRRGGRSPPAEGLLFRFL
jgi:hypothetical protein